MTLTITTNNRPRPIIDAYELTPKERVEFDYLNWPAIEAGEDSASFFRYRGQLYDLGDIMTTRSVGAPEEFKQWDGYASDSFFSGILVRFAEDNESVIVATYYS